MSVFYVKNKRFFVENWRFCVAYLAVTNFFWNISDFFVENKRFFLLNKRFFFSKKRFILSDFLSPNRVPSNFFTRLGDFLSLNYDFLIQSVYTNRDQSRRFKKIGKIRLGSKLSLGLIYGLSFRIQAASYFPQS